MQEFRDVFNEHRIDKLEAKVNILTEALSNEMDHNTTTSKAILEALETIQRITENLDQRIRRLEGIVLFKEKEEEDS